MLVGTLLYFLGLAILFETSNPVLFPLIALLGSFTVPLSYVAFFYDRRSPYAVSISTVALCLFYGGVLGSFGASLLEPVFVRAGGLLPAMQIGLIEEFAKLIGVVLIAGHAKQRSAVMGVILGAAAGMGFAAFESMGYTFVTYFQSRAQIPAITEVTVIRGLLAPLGHGTWTAILVAVLFRESTDRHLNFNGKVIWTYLLVSFLHGAWDWISWIAGFVAITATTVYLSYSLIGVVGLLILRSLWKESKLKARSEEIVGGNEAPTNYSDNR